jgi:hypothetical protein
LDREKSDVSDPVSRCNSIQQLCIKELKPFVGCFGRSGKGHPNWNAEFLLWRRKQGI